MFLYAVWYFISELEISGGVPSTLYFGYMTLVSGIFFFVTSAIGFLCLFMVREQDSRLHQGGLGGVPFLPRVRCPGFFVLWRATKPQTRAAHRNTGGHLS